MAYNSAYTGAQVDAAVGAVRNKETTWDSKQNALSGTEDQLVGFNASGEAAAVPMPSAANVGADPAGTAESAVSAHNQASDAHSTQFNAKANASDLTAHTGNKNNPHGVTAAQVGAAKPGVVFTVTLLASGWSGNSQTVSDERFLASGYAYVTNPADDDFTKWGGAIVRGQDVTTNGQMAFTCEETPAENITVKILRVEAAEA